ncbi:prostaglandin E synthase 3-like [Octodon degus]|uniref:Prostaglandin E synthase 3-like n=1 Tax=Octodon degus TaxID=10160 RepID=A0A6P6DIW2_OCTDE|nr:prostaglandin E synthase 3-like [Octodon degus]
MPDFGGQPASAKCYDRRAYVFIEFCVEDSKDVNVNFEKSKLTFSCLEESDNFKHLNEIDPFHCIDPRRTKLNWLSVDFNNWKDWEDDSDEDMSKMMNNMGGGEDVDLAEVVGADDDSQDSDDEKIPDLE